jgi:histidinol-phosphatase (PHP family)
MSSNEKAQARSGLPDYHIHTPLCGHAVGDARAYVAAARKAGIPEMCFTDHGPNPHGYDSAHRMTMDDMPTYVADVASAREDRAPGVLLGIETDYYEGCEPFLREWLQTHAFDLVIGSVHYIGDWGFDSPSQRQAWASVDVTAAWRAYFELVGRLAESGLYDVVGHLDLPKKFGYRPPEGLLTEMAGPPLDKIARAGMGIEINTAGLRKPVKEIYPSAPLLTLARERNIPVCFGSDAHRPDEVGAGFSEAVELALSCGYTEYFRIRRRSMRLVPIELEPGGTLIRRDSL